jgi:hypothetical protein
VSENHCELGLGAYPTNVVSNGTQLASTTFGQSNGGSVTVTAQVVGFLAGYAVRAYISFLRHRSNY